MATLTANAIREQIEAQVLAGDLAAGERLPSVRAHAEDLGVSPATVAAAYRELRRRGLITTGKGRQGTRVAPARGRRSETAPLVASGLIDASHGSPDPSRLPDLAPALAFAASLPQPTYAGQLISPHLAEVGRSLFTADGLEADHLAVTSGAMDAIERVMRALELRPGDRIGVEDPGHIPVHQLARSGGLELVPLPIDDYGIMPAGLDTALDRGLSALIITPRAHNPTGAALNAERAEQLTKALAPHPATALIQDDHAGLISGVNFYPVTPPGERWATMRSLGKSFGPDLRLALMTGDQRTIERVCTGLSNGPGWVSFILQRAAAFLLDDPATMKTLRDTAESYAKRRSLVVERLAEHQVSSTGRSGLNVWIPTPHDTAAIEAARQAGFAIRLGGSYCIANQRAVRITISTLSDAEALAVADAVAAAHHAQPRAAAM